MNMRMKHWWNDSDVIIVVNIMVDVILLFLVLLLLDHASFKHPYRAKQLHEAESLRKQLHRAESFLKS
jgi:hypothetical protein